MFPRKELPTSCSPNRRLTRRPALGKPNRPGLNPHASPTGPRYASSMTGRRFPAVTIRIGTAGWSIPRQTADKFSGEGSALERYASRLSAAEINSSFHRSHRLSTWQRWHDSVPEHFRFSVKLPKTITHVRKLVNCEVELDEFFEQATVLGAKLGVLLVQLPPKHVFDPAAAQIFFKAMSDRIGVEIACEPRHPSWFAPAADRLLISLGVSRVAADPSICEAAARPGGWRGLSYWRLHGSPVIYRSSYRDRIQHFAEQLTADSAASRDVWCIFDNTASSEGAGDALRLSERLTADGA